MNGKSPISASRPTVKRVPGIGIELSRSHARKFSRSRSSRSASLSGPSTSPSSTRSRSMAGGRVIWVLSAPPLFATPTGDSPMTIKVGDRLPDGKLMESTEFDSATQCATAPKEVNVAEAAKGKKIAVFGLPGAFTPTCSAKHVPSYVQNMDKLRAKGVDEIWCISVNDAFVMGAWGKDQKAGGKVRMMADGSAIFTKALGLDMDLTARGMGVRSQRYSLLVDNGVVRAVNVEQPGKFEVSDAETLLKPV